MFEKLKGNKTPAIIIVLTMVLYLSVLMLLLNTIIAKTGIHQTFLLPIVSIVLLFFSTFITWIFFQTKKPKKNNLLLLNLLFTLYFVISYLILRQVIAHLIGFPPLPGTQIVIFILALQLVFGIPFAYFYLNSLFLQLKNSKVEVDLKKNELENLKNQLSPHFLFNHLNNIYATIMIDKDIALDYTHRFSDMMRFYHNMIGQELISLTDEINYIDNYLVLEKYKMGDRLRLTYTKNIDHINHSIPPFILTPFIETAIERSQGLGALPFIDIDLKVHDGMLTLKVNNSIPEKPGRVKKQILIDKIKSQLQFMYHNQFTLSIEKVNHLEQSILEFPI